MQTKQKDSGLPKHLTCLLCFIYSVNSDDLSSQYMSGSKRNKLSLTESSFSFLDKTTGNQSLWLKTENGRKVMNRMWYIQSTLLDNVKCKVAHAKSQITDFKWAPHTFFKEKKTGFLPLMVEEKQQGWKNDGYNYSHGRRQEWGAFTITPCNYRRVQNCSGASSSNIWEGSKGVWQSLWSK